MPNDQAIADNKVKAIYALSHKMRANGIQSSMYYRSEEYRADVLEMLELANELEALTR